MVEKIFLSSIFQKRFGALFELCLLMLMSLSQKIHVF